MRKYVCLCVMVIFSLGMQPAHAKKVSAAKSHAEKKERAKKVEEAEASDEEGHEPDTAGSITTEFQCELGNKVTIY